MFQGDRQSRLDGRAVQIDGHDPLHRAGPDEIGDDAGPDRLTPAHSPVLTGIAKVRDHGRETPGSRPMAGVGQQQEFEKMLLDRGRRRLDQEDVAAADRLLDLDVELTVRIALDHPLAERDPKRRWRFPRPAAGSPTRRRSTGSWHGPDGFDATHCADQRSSACLRAAR